jgi:WD40 repeat protein
MLACPHCLATLDVGFGRPAPCPRCGLMVPGDSVDPGNGTIVDASLSTELMNATIDSIPAFDPPQVAKPPTVHGNLAATLDSWEAIDAPPGPKTFSDATARTIDSDTSFELQPEVAAAHDTGFSISPPTPRAPRQTAHDKFAQTIESDQIPADLRKVTGVWSKTFSPDARPWQTIKGQERFQPKDSKLVIKRRSLKTVSREKSTGLDYELLGIIGEGGMGVVYSARQASIDRNVAIKMLKPEAANDAERREKFLSEAVVTGDLDHPNIVPIYDLGSNEQNALFYAMKRVQGTPWSAVIAQKSQAENLEILMKVADAVGFAHSRGVVHRDLKPENVMLGEYGEVLVMDWGLALSTPDFRKAESVTQSTSMGGTPAYMAPEMAMGPVERVGPLADVYLLGAMLYEIITGKPPHAGESVITCLHAAARNQIQPTDASGELIDIAFHAMAAEPASRYPGVRELQDAIREYQDHSESIALAARAEQDLEKATSSDHYQTFARALFAFEEAEALWTGNDRARDGARAARLAYARSAERKADYDLAASLLTDADPDQKELREKVLAAARERDARQGRLRNAKRLLVALAATVAVVVTAAYFQVRRDRDLAVAAEHEATVQRDKAQTAEREATAQRDKAQVAKLEATRQRDKAEQARIEAETARGEEAKQKLVAQKATLVAEQKRKDEAAARQEAETAKTAAVAAKQAEEYEAYVARIGLAAAKIDENSFGYAEELLAECPAELRNWEWGRLKFLCQQSVRTFSTKAPIDSVAYSPDGKRFVSGGWDGTVKIWSVKNGKLLRTIPYGALYVNGVAWSPDGKSIAAAGSDSGGEVKVWNADSGELLQVFHGHQDSALSVTFSKDSQRLLTTSYDNTARLWNVRRGEALRAFLGHNWWVWSAAFSPDETEVATASQDGTVRLWQVAKSTDETTTAPKVFAGHRGPVFAVTFSHHGNQVASGGYDNRVLIWNPNSIKPFDYEEILSGAIASVPPFKALDGHTAAVHSLAFSADDRMLVSGSHDNTVRIWNVAELEPIKTLRGHAGWVRACRFAPDGSSVLTGSHDHDAKIWSIGGYEEMRVLRARMLEGHDDAVLSAAFSPNGKRIATASRDRTAKTWDFATGKELQTFQEGHEFLASSAVFSRDGRRLLTAAIDNSTRLWDVATGTQQFVLEGTGRSAALAISPDSTLILTGSDNRDVRLWSAADGKLLYTLDKYPGEVSAVAFNHAGNRFATGDAAGHVRVWNTATRTQAWSSDAHNGRITSIAFTPDDTRLLTGCIDRTVGHWDAATGNELKHLLLKHPQAVTSLALDPQGRFVATCAADHVARVWSLADATLLGVFSEPHARINSVDVSADGRKLLTVGEIEIRQPETNVQQTPERRSFARIWDLGSGKPLDDLRVRGTEVWAGLFAPDGASVLTVGGNFARLWEIATGVQRMSFSPNGAVASVGFSPDSQCLVTASWDNSARIWNVASGKAELELKDCHSAAVNAAMFSPNGKTVLTASDDHSLKLWDARSAAVLKSYTGHTGRVRSASFSDDGTQFISGSADKTARLWNIQTGKVVRQFAGHAWGVTSVDLSADSSRMISGSEDNTAKIWDVASGTCLHTLAGHTAAVVSVAFSPDGRRAATASQDNICKIWDTATGKEILTLKAHSQELTSVTFSTDGSSILTASRDGAAIVWLTTDWRSSAAKP